jgi:hypothetical protein
MPDPSHPRLSFRAPTVIFWTALFLRIAVILIGRTYRIHHTDNNWEFGYEAGRIAAHVATGHGYTSPFNGPTGPTAWLPPVFPLLLALCFKLFGVYSRLSAFAILAINSVFSSLMAPAVYEIAARCFDAQGIARRSSTKAAPVALWSAWLWAAYPAALQFAIHWIWEMSVSACLFTWTFVFALRLRRIGEPHDDSQPDIPSTTRRNIALWAIFGILWGLVALSNASLLLCFPATILWILWPRLRTLSVPALIKPITGAALASVLFLAVNAPWVIRNERDLHAFIPTRSNLGIEFWQSTLFWHDAFPWGSAVPLSASDPEFKLFQKMGEVPYAAMRQKQAIANIKAQPRLFVRNTLYRFQYFWFGVPHPTEQHPINEVGRIFNYAATSLAGLLGLFLAIRRKVPAAWLLSFPFFLVPTAYYIVTVQARFRHPIEPILTILVVYLFRSTTPRKQPLQMAERENA